MKNVMTKGVLVLALGMLFSTTISAREVRRSHGKCRQCRSEQRFVRCNRCGKFVDLRNTAAFREGRTIPMRRGELQAMRFGGPKQPMRMESFRHGPGNKARFHKQHWRHSRR